MLGEDMRSIVFKNVALAFSKFYKSNQVNISEIVEKAKQYKCDNFIPIDSIVDRIEFESLVQAVAYIFSVEDQIDERAIMEYPLNFNFETGKVDE